MLLSEIRRQLVKAPLAAAMRTSVIKTEVPFVPEVLDDYCSQQQ